VILGLLTLVLLVWTVLQWDQGSDPEDPSTTGDAPSGEPDSVRTRGSTARAPSPDAGVAPVPTDERPVGNVFARARWGGGPGDLARSRPDEANAEAPMSLAQGPNGTVVVLDQLNGRLVRFGPDGQPIGTTPLEMTAPQDLAIAEDGTVAVLDRLADRNVTVVGPDGEVVGSFPIEGEGIEEGGGTTAVVVDGEDIYVEREHSALVRIGDVHGRAATERNEIPGRPSRDGRSYLMAGLIEASEGRFYVNSIDRESDEHRFTREIRVPLALRAIVLLDTDETGTIYVAVAGEPFDGPPETEQGRLLCLAGSDGTTIGATVLPANTDPDETLREMIVLEGGGVLYAVRSDDGVSLERFDCQ
jgi:hypothetical protein